MSIKTVYDTLITRLQTVTGLPTLQKENNRKPGSLGSGKDSWSRATILPSRTKIETIGPQGFNEMIGLLQVDIFYPADSDYAASFTMADTILDKFIAGTIINNVIIQNGYVLSAQTVNNPGTIPNYYQLSIMIEWSLYKQRPLVV